LQSAELQSAELQSGRLKSGELKSGHWRAELKQVHRTLEIQNGFS
jgi:hypothetical protein